MNTKHFILAVAVVVFAACSQMEIPIEEIVPENSTNSETPIALSYSTVEVVESKAAQDLNEGTFTSGESIKVRVSNTGANTWEDYIFTTGDAGAMTAPEPAPYYPAGAQNIDIVAYYPASAGTSFTVATDQTADADYKASDLMFASVTNQAEQAEAVNLAFSHKMAKLCVNITPGQGVTSITSLSVLNVKPTVSFNQETGAVGAADGEAISIAMSNNGAAIIPAQTINGGLLSIVTDKGAATYSVTDKVFEAGKRYTINITVNLRAVGTTTEITGWTSEGTVTVNPVTTSKTPAGLEAIDMGNGIKWANMNLGAKTVTDYGDYFAWGETLPYYEEGYAQENPCTHWKFGKTGYNWANYSLCNGSGESINKYNAKDYMGYVDNKTELERIHDAASINWGGSWRMPTSSEWEWLLNSENCTWTWTTIDGINGMLVRSLKAGYTDNALFLPAAGSRCDSDLDDVGSDFNYWSSTCNEDGNGARTVWIDWYDEHPKAKRWSFYRYWGLSIRPVTE